MSLTHLSSDACTIHQEETDSMRVFDTTMNPIQNFRPLPGSQGAGVIVDRMGNAQNQVELESLMRNQAFVSSSCPEYRLQADRCFAPYMQNTAPLQCASNQLVPQVSTLRRSCDPMSGQFIDRFAPLIQHYAGQNQGYAVPPLDTRASFKDQLERSRNAYIPQ